MENTQESPKTYSVEVRMRDGQYDEVILQTDDFREALSSYDSLCANMKRLLHACGFDMVCFYVMRDSGEYVPVVVSAIETDIKEW